MRYVNFFISNSRNYFVSKDKSSKIQRPRGTRDLLPEEMFRRRKLESIMRRISQSFGYGEIQTPSFEHLRLFTIKSGEGVIDEIYAFKDKSGRDLALRPELTAPVIRAFVNECSVLPRPLRFYYFANCFRYERPQKARYREFWQFGVELIGSSSYLADAEIILLANNILKETKIDFELKIGHVGLLRQLLKEINGEDASKIIRFIDKKDTKGLKNFIDSINIPAQIEENIFSIIEMEGDKEILKSVKRMVPDFDVDYIEKLCEMLDFLNVDYKLNMGIARGLDYYTGIVFEAFAKTGLGAQSQICGGGSYRLSHLFGGQNIPSTGFALGFDRIAELFGRRFDAEKESTIYIINLGQDMEVFRVADLIRNKTKQKVIADVTGKNLKKQMSFASNIKADYVIIIGENELRENKLKLKDMLTGEQRSLSLEEILSIFEQINSSYSSASCDM